MFAHSTQTLYSNNKIMFFSESMIYPVRPPLELCIAHAHQLQREMSSSSLGSCAFVNMDEIVG